MYKRQAYDNAARVKVIIKCLALTKELRREKEVELLHALFGILQVEACLLYTSVSRQVSPHPITNSDRTKK